MRTTSATGPPGYHGLPFVVLMASPPNDFAAIYSHISGSEFSISCRMPFLGNIRSLGQQTVVVADFFSGTIWAASTGISTVNCSLPFMALATPPPDFHSGIWCNISRGHVAVSFRMPLLCHLGVYLAQAIEEVTLLLLQVGQPPPLVLCRIPVCHS